MVSEVEPSSQVKTWNSKFARIWARVADESPKALSKNKLNNVMCHAVLWCSSILGEAGGSAH